MKTQFTLTGSWFFGNREFTSGFLYNIRAYVHISNTCIHTHWHIVKCGLAFSSHMFITPHWHHLHTQLRRRHYGLSPWISCCQNFRSFSIYLSFISITLSIFDFYCYAFFCLSTGALRTPPPLPRHFAPKTGKCYSSKPLPILRTKRSQIRDNTSTFILISPQNCSAKSGKILTLYLPYTYLHKKKPTQGFVLGFS